MFDFYVDLFNIAVCDVALKIASSGEGVAGTQNEVAREG